MIPPHVGYSPTRLGGPMAERARGPYRRVEHDMDDIEAAPNVYDERGAGR